MNPEIKREEKKAYDKAYRAAHLEKRNAYNKTYYYAHREERKVWGRAYYYAHREEKSHYHRRRKHGISQAEFAVLLEKQGHRCAICYTNEFGSRGPIIDHDHSTGKIRGILCTNCNTALGLIKDSSVRLRKAAEYLETR